MNHRYLLCTVAKNEELYFSKTASDVLSQTACPSVWLLLDDQSTDGTTDLMQQLTSKYSWIHYFKYNQLRPKDLGKHLARLKGHASNLAIQAASEQRIPYEFIGILDADIRINPRFYEEMIHQMVKTPEIGLISGEIWEYDGDGKLYLKNGRKDLPGGATMFCRKECFDDVNGIDPQLYPFDAVMVAKAKLGKWETKRSKTITAIQMRKTSSVNGIKNGYRYEGEKVYFLQYNFFYVLARTIYIALTEGFRYGCAFFNGYMKKVLSFDERLNDKRLINYFKRERFREIIKYRFGCLLKECKCGLLRFIFDARND